MARCAVLHMPPSSWGVQFVKGVGYCRGLCKVFACLALGRVRLSRVDCLCLSHQRCI